jgi:hypothetical protein
VWTFQTLAAADRGTLEQVLLKGSTPDPVALEGTVHRGWNHEPIATLSGRKFRKAFYRRDGALVGHNQVVEQDGKGPGGEWRVKLKDGRPEQIGYYRVVPAIGPPRYAHALRLDYDVPQNRGLHVVLRLIQDDVVLPNPGDHDLLLGKAYLRLGPVRVFFSYFVLGEAEAEPEREPPA